MNRIFAEIEVRFFCIITLFRCQGTYRLKNHIGCSGTKFALSFLAKRRI